MKCAQPTEKPGAEAALQNSVLPAALHVELSATRSFTETRIQLYGQLYWPPFPWKARTPDPAPGLQSALQVPRRHGLSPFQEWLQRGNDRLSSLSRRATEKQRSCPSIVELTHRIFLKPRRTATASVDGATKRSAQTARPSGTSASSSTSSMRSAATGCLCSVADSTISLSNFEVLGCIEAKFCKT